ncbi:Sucrase/ferredoxin-like-domain-containing protein [Gamsiella multidivaricata]|uniref:Sucrase/ferredoxin-like-domain-containing protein n=1 Tax=Gamsiella multidivaricata TaxID=101098 RepID=UPI00221F86C1|nr:Sucrase/ferredoxin-like-domain-containing protein [Gamsiella multidivaricata]KAG0369832.1 hypothetical protein BGZ54_008730 [Gamsiella multidivaricata]KAI7819434.1 Sucrase/ferredoxin-like-domain-containing protein [Gamsiella multidivaricata]
MSTALRIATSARACCGTLPLLARAFLSSTSGSKSVRSVPPLLRFTHSNHALHRPNPLLRTSPQLLKVAHSKTIPSRLSASSSAFFVHSRRVVSTTAAPAAKAEEDEPIQGSAPSYERHLLICTGTPSENWVKKPELSDPYHNLLMTTVRGQEVKVNFTDEPSGEHQEDILSSRGPRHDLILFPDNVKFRGIRYEAFRDLSRFLEQHPSGTLRPKLEKMISERTSLNSKKSAATSSVRTELIPGSGEPITIDLIAEPSAVLVCTHGSRDCRCGEQGGDFYRVLKDMVQATGLSGSIKIYGVSHIGGHKYAPNTIMYPSGDWHGHLSELDSVDAQQILFDALANGGIAGRVRERPQADPVMIDKWRGRMGMSKEEQIQLYQQVLKKQKQRSLGSGQLPGQQQPQSLFSAPGDDLYEDDGLKDQKTAVSVESEKPSTSQVTIGDGASRVRVVFETYQKVRTEIDAKVGERILDIVKDKDPSRHGIYQALECTCGGQLECATCHVYIEPPYSARLPGVTDAEEDMLEYAVGRRDSSRLGCQIKIQPDLEGMVIKLPQY